MGTINVSVDARKLDEVTRLLADVKNGVPKALVGAINDTARQTVTQISKAIREKVNIKKKDIDPHIRRTTATAGRMSARITLSESKRLGLKYFGAREYGAKGRGVQRQAGGVSYQIDKRGGRKRIPGAFEGPPRLGGQIFKRLGKKRLPIRKLQGISPWGAFVMSGMRRKTQAEALALLEKNIDRRVNFLLLKQSGQIK